MGKYSDDPAVEAAVEAAEADYVAAQEAFAADKSEANAEALASAEQAFVLARSTSRTDRAGLSVTAEGE